MLANYLADVVADEASKRLVADLNREERAKRCEQTGTNVAKRLALVQADVRAKHEEAGDVEPDRSSSVIGVPVVSPAEETSALALVRF